MIKKHNLVVGIFSLLLGAWTQAGGDHLLVRPVFLGTPSSGVQESSQSADERTLKVKLDTDCVGIGGWDYLCEYGWKRFRAQVLDQAFDLKKHLGIFGPMLLWRRSY